MYRISLGLRNGISGIAERLELDERGATATEYALLTAFIAMAIVAGVGAFGTALGLHYGDLVTGLKTALGIP